MKKEKCHPMTGLLEQKPGFSLFPCINLNIEGSSNNIRAFSERQRDAIIPISMIAYISLGVTQKKPFQKTTFHFKSY